MSLQDPLHQQILAFHAAVIDDCDRAARPEKTDTMVLRLRNNALALARLQLAMMVVHDREPVAFRPNPEPAETPPPLAPDQPLGAQPGGRRSSATPKRGLPAQQRILTGDALSRFVSHRLQPDESTHDVWQDLQADEATKRRRNPALPRTGFRSPSG